MYIIERLPCRPSECFHLHPLAVYDAPLVPSFPYFFNQRDHITNTDVDSRLSTVNSLTTCLKFVVSNAFFLYFLSFKAGRGSSGYPFCRARARYKTQPGNRH